MAFRGECQSATYFKMAEDSVKINVDVSADENERLPSHLAELLPDSSICQPTLETARKVLHSAIFNHSLRVYLHAVNLLMKENAQPGFQPSTFFPSLPIDRGLLLVASLFHDAGTSSIYNGNQRFEVEGADAACSHLKSHGINSEADLQRVWSAIALHTSPGIAERIDPFTRILRIAVRIDFNQTARDDFGASEFAVELEHVLPRMNIEKVLSDAVVMQADKFLDTRIRIDGRMWPDTTKHPKASWPGILLRAHLENPDHEGVNSAF